VDTCDTYESIAEMLRECGGFCSGTDADGQLVLFQRAPQYGNCVKRTTFQDNGWAVAHWYHEDGTVEETFESC